MSFLDNLSVLSNYQANTSLLGRLFLSGQAIEAIEALFSCSITPDRAKMHHLSDLSQRTLTKITHSMCFMLFARVFNPQLIQKLQRLQAQSKLLKKAMTLGIRLAPGSSELNIATLVAESEQALSLDRYLFEKMAYFGHPLQFNEKGELLLTFTSHRSIAEDVTSYGTPEQQIRNMLPRWQQQGTSIMIRGQFEEGCYRSLEVSDATTVDELLPLLVDDNGRYRSGVHLISPPQHLTVDAIRKQQDAVASAAADRRLPPPRFVYSTDGFINYGSTLNNALPIEWIPESDDFRCELIVHEKSGGGARQTHVSLKIKTPSGEVYSFGFEPSEELWESGKSAIFQSRAGKIQVPDPRIFFPRNLYTQHSLNYSIPDAESFHKLMAWLEAVQSGQGDEGNTALVYHGIYSNCATFGRAVRDFVLQNGGKPEPLQRPHHFRVLQPTCPYRIVEWILNSPLSKPLGWDSRDRVVHDRPGSLSFPISDHLSLPVELIAEHLELRNSDLS